MLYMSTTVVLERGVYIPGMRSWRRPKDKALHTFIFIFSRTTGWMFLIGRVFRQQKSKHTCILDWILRIETHRFCKVEKTISSFILPVTAFQL